MVLVNKRWPCNWSEARCVMIWFAARSFGGVSYWRRYAQARTCVLVCIPASALTNIRRISNYYFFALCFASA
jgi:hypothetical protein